MSNDFRDIGISSKQAAEALSALRRAGLQLHVDRLRAELEASFMTSRRARLVWKLAGVLSRRSNRRSA